MHNPLARLLSATVFLWTASLALGQSGQLDSTFVYDGPSGSVTAIAADGRTFIAAIDAGKLRSKRQSRLIRVDNRGHTLAESGMFEAQIRTLLVTSSGHIAAGGVLPGGIARFTSSLQRDTNFNVGLGANRPVLALGEQADGRLLAAGQFTTFNGSKAGRLVRLHANGTVDSTFTAPAINNTVNALAVVSTNRILIAGNFSSVQRQHMRVAALTATGSPDTNFVAPLFNGPVNALARTPSGQWLAGGNFKRAGAQSLNRLARLNADGTLDSSFDIGLGANKSVRQIAPLANGHVMVAGDFTLFNGAPAPRLVRLLSTGAADSTFLPGTAAAKSPLVLAPNGTSAFAGGAFTNWNGVAQRHLVRLFGDLRVETPPQDVVAASGTDVSFQVGAISSGGVSYQWLRDGLPISGATTSSLSIFQAQSPDEGGYSVTVSTEHDQLNPPSATLAITTPPNSAPGAVSFPDERNLLQAISASSQVEFATDGVIRLSRTLRITNTLSLRAGGFDVTLLPPANQRIISVSSNGALWAWHMVFANNRLNGDETIGGGALRNEGGMLALVHCTFTNNSVRADSGVLVAGGAVWNSGTLWVSNCYFANNSAAGSIGGRLPLSAAGGDAAGGAIYSAAGTVTLAQTSFIRNSADGGDPAVSVSIFGAGQGGALAVDGGTLASSGCLYSGNQANGGLADGGAWAISAGTARGDHDVFTGNAARGIYTDQFQIAEARGGAIANSGTLTLRFANLTNNAAADGNPSQGGAIYSDAELNLGESLVAFNNATGSRSFGINYLFSHPSGDGLGGGLSVAGGANLTNITLAFNTAQGGAGSQPDEVNLYTGRHGFGGGIHASPGKLNLMHLTLAANTAAPGSGQNPGTMSGGGIHRTGAGADLMSCVFSGNYPHNFHSAAGAPAFLDAGWNISSDATPDFHEIGSAVDLDPLLGPLQDNGGPSATMSLLPGSPALDIGDDIGAFAPATDQRGLPRVASGFRDSGAHEAQ